MSIVLSKSYLNQPVFMSPYGMLFHQVKKPRVYCTSADFTASVCEGDLFCLGAVELRTAGGHHSVHRALLFKVNNVGRFRVHVVMHSNTIT